MLLHEWAHTLGVLHSSGEDRVMNPMYSIHGSGFSNEDMALLRAGLAARLAARQGEPDWSGLRTVLETTKSPKWFTRDREEMLRAIAPKSAESPAPSPGRVAADSDAHYSAYAESARKERAPALPHAAEGMRRGEKVLKEDNWIWLAGLFRQLDSPTWTEEALGHASAGTDALRTDVARARKIWGVPKTSASTLPPDKEDAYVALWRSIMDDLGQGRLKLAAKRLAEGKQQFPGVPGILTLSCELALMQRQLPSAEKNCKAALSAMEEHLLAHIQPRQTGWRRRGADRNRR